MHPKQLGNYDILEKIGAGGMGEVFRARDPRLNRDVALKILPPVFADDPDRLGRFEREARLLASLNHPGIGAIYGLEQAEGQRFLVLELIPGEDLSQRIARGAMPLDEALPVARDIAEAVEFAHEQGIVHRDLKPANVKITGEGRVKVLDFGLAKAFESDDPRDPRLSQSPTLLTSSPSMAGVILGTAAYMSPEQARGKTVDKRSDVFAFGCVLFEMLTGRQAFEGDTISDTLASVLKTQPDLTQLPGDTPRAIRDLLKRCLEKDPKLRLRDIGEARITIDHARHAGADETALATAAVAPARGRKRDLAWAAALLAVAVVSFFGAKRMTPPAPDVPLRKFVMEMEESANAVHEQRLALSPDGSRLAYIFNERLWVRELSRLEPIELPGTEGADGPAWSPDGTQIAYRAGTTFYRIPAEGGTPVLIAATSLSFTGGSSTWWAEDGRILFGTGGTGIMQVSAMGGDPTEIPLAADETDVHEPSTLPGGRGIIYAAHLKSGGPCEIRLLVGEKRTSLVNVADQRLWGPRYASTGHILYRRTPNNSGVWALPFSLSSLEVTGEPFLVAGDGAEPCPGPDGMLAYLLGGAEGAVELAIINRDGTLDSKIEGGPYEVAGGQALSPDGKRLAAVISETNNGDVWVIDLVRGTRTRLTFATGWDILPSWSPDGKFVYYTTPGDLMTYEVLADGSGSPRPVHKGFATAVSPDGRWIAFDDDTPSEQSDIFVMPAPGDTSTTPRTLVSTGANETNPHISPDGSYVAYQSNESGDIEVYLTRFPEPGGKWQVSTRGGARPRWDPAGGKLYYTSATEVMEVDVVTTPTLQLGTPRAMFEIAKARMLLGRNASYDVFRGGRQFVITYASETEVKPHLKIVVVENWLSEFKTAKK